MPSQKPSRTAMLAGSSVALEHEVATIVLALVLAMGCARSRRAEDGPNPETRPTSPAASRVVVPIAIRPKYKNPRSLGIAVPVRFASPRDPSAQRTLDLELDTGSSGVVVFADSLGGVSLERIGEPRSHGYGGGDVYEEQSALARVAIGDAVVPEPIVVEVVDRVHCAPERPSCNAAAGNATYMTDQGFHGVLGVGTRSLPGREAYSPIAQIPGALGRSYAVEAKSLRLIIGPSQDDLAGFERHALPRWRERPALPNGAPAFDDRSVPLCLTVQGAEVADSCGPALIDSGSWSLVFAGLRLPERLRSDGALAEGTRVSATLFGTLRWQYSATFHRAYVSEQGLLGGFDRVLGMPFFEEFDVLFEIRDGTIGLRPAR